MQLTNSLRKDIASLSALKHRRDLGWFKAEGTKCVLDTIGHFRLEYLIATDAWFEAHPEFSSYGCAIKVAPKDIERMSDFSTASDVLAVYALPVPEFDLKKMSGSLILALDSIQDPGNLGTIIRTADWFGIRDILCSRSTADAFSPKVIQATMGAISRVAVHYVDLSTALDHLAQAGADIFGTFLNGENIYRAHLSPTGVVVMGNEGKGISPAVSRLITRRLRIPSFPDGADTSESLNVAVATAITLSEFRRL